MMLSLIFRRFPQVTSFQRTLATAPPPAPFVFQEPHPLYTAEAAPYDETPYRLLTTDFVRKIPNPLGFGLPPFLTVEGEGLTRLTEAAITDISHLLRTTHLALLRRILDDEEASANDKFVALELLKNANVAAGMVLPGCQDTGTAILVAKKGDMVLTTCKSDHEAISRGVYDAYTRRYLRYSQMAPLSMYEEVNTKTNLPAQIDIYSKKGNSYEFLYFTKGGGSANKTFLFQQTKALLNHDSMLRFLDEKIKTLGTSACPPYHLAIVIGGTSAEDTLKTVKLASAKYLDSLPTTGNAFGRAFRDVALEAEVLKMTQQMGIGAQFGGKYFCHDVRVVRLPRHGASCPVGLGVSCSADRQIKAKITEEGIFLEQLETNPARFLPEVAPAQLSDAVVEIDLNQPMSKVLEQLYKCPVKTRLSVTGTLVVARDIAHAKIKERLDAGLGMPQYMKDHVVYYAGPAKTPEGYPSGSFGPTTAGRMDSYVDLFMQHGGSMISLAKGNRSNQVSEACKKHKGFYLGSIGGAAGILARDSIKKVSVLDFPELGMEAVWKIEVENFPCFVLIDHQGNDFFKKLLA